MITDYLLFSEMANIEDAIIEFGGCNPTLISDDWDFVVRGTSTIGLNTISAAPKNGKHFFAMSPCHFWHWV